MRTFRIATAVLAALATAATVAAVAAAGTNARTIAFSARYAGKAVVKVTDNVADITASGTGSGTAIGAGKVTGTGKGDSSVRPCVPFAGIGRLTGTGGTTVQFRVVPGTRGCGDEAGQVFSISGRATVLRATGRLRGARGSLKLTGVYDRGRGTFSVKFTGTLTK